MLFFLRVRPGPRAGRQFGLATPRLGRQAGAETFLHPAKLAVKRVGAQLVKNRIGTRRRRIKQPVRCQQTKAGPRPVNPPAPAGFSLHHPARLGQQFGLRGIWRGRGSRFGPAEKPFQQFSQPAGFPLGLRQIYIHEHDLRRVQHLAAVGIPGDDRRHFSVGSPEFAEDGFAQGSVAPVSIPARQRYLGVIPRRRFFRVRAPDRLRFGQAVVRPAPAGKFLKSVPCPKIAGNSWKNNCPEVPGQSSLQTDRPPGCFTY